MKVNDFVKTIGFIKNKLKHFSFYLYDDNDYNNSISINEVTLDDYIHLCDRKVIDWAPETDGVICLAIKIKKSDSNIFKQYIEK